MPRDDRITWLEDVSPADWIRPHLRTGLVDTASIIPEGFEAYCRIFHPWDTGTGRAMSWAEVAAENGRVVHSEMQAHMISRPSGTAAPRYDLNDYLNRMEWGHLPLPERAVLVDLLRPATPIASPCWFCVWEGWGNLDFSPVTARIEHPNRNYVLYSGPIDLALASLDDGDWDSPNLWWPDDRSW